MSRKLSEIVPRVARWTTIPYSPKTQAVEFTVKSQVLLPNVKFYQVQTRPTSRGGPIVVLEEPAETRQSQNSPPGPLLHICGSAGIILWPGGLWLSLAGTLRKRKSYPGGVAGQRLWVFPIRSRGICRRIS